MDLNLTGKVVLVTGVSYGIGAAVAATLLTEGAVVVGTSRTTAGLHPGVAHVPLDMSAPTAGDAAVAACLERAGRLDVLVNNVGSARFGTGFVTEDDATWDEFWELNVMSAVRTTRAALPHLQDGGGVVVNVSSTNGRMPDAALYAYSAGKAAMDNLTVNLGREYAGLGVRVVGVAPGPVETPLWLGPHGAAAQASALGGGDPVEIIAETRRAIPLRRFSTAQEVADLVAFLVSDRAGSVTATTVTVDGGLTPAR